MIKCNKINGQTIYINAELIEFIEETPDTIVSTTTGNFFLLDLVEEVIEEIVKYEKRIFEGLNIKLTDNMERGKLH